MSSRSPSPARRAPRSPRFLARAAAAALSLTLASPAARAQGDYFNTDAGRPIRVEDAYAVERYALDLHLAPVTVERRVGATDWMLNPEIAYGLLPRTQIEVGVPIGYRGGTSGRSTGVAGIDLSTLYNFNVETLRWPALAVRLGALLPVGRFGPENYHASATALATRSYDWGRLHVNGTYTTGTEPAGRDPGRELSRWLAGAAVDRTFPLQSFLLTAEAYAAQPVGPDARTAWTIAGGIRFQATPYVALDAGLGRRVSGSDPAWFITFGVARLVPMKLLMPGVGRWGR